MKSTTKKNYRSFISQLSKTGPIGGVHKYVLTKKLENDIGPIKVIPHIIVDIKYLIVSSSSLLI